MYKYANDENVDQYVEVIRSLCGKDSSDLTLYDGVADPRYRIATWVNIFYIIFHELTGINVINMYSNTMLDQMN